MRADEIKRWYLGNEVSLALQKFGKDILEKTKSKCFGFDRIYNDGSCLRFTSRPELVQYLLENNHRITAEFAETCSHQKSFSFFLSKETQEMGSDFEPHRQLMHNFQLGTGFQQIDRNFGYYDQVWFVCPLGLNYAANLFLIHKTIMDEFIIEFKAWMSPWLSSASTHRILIPRSMLTSVRGIVEQSELSSLQNDPLSSLTKRELQCVAFISLGQTASDIALTLGLSVRTVEHYIENIKEKLGCKRKSQVSKLVAGLSQHPIYIEKIKTEVNKYIKREYEKKHDLHL